MNGLATASKRYTKKSFMAFLEGQPTCNEKWILGVVRASTQQDILEALNSLSEYGNRERFDFLKRACGVVSLPS